jgi:diaminohydroxyphosphoribosylaminopyrimidine deaminase/5-amino-6-(5-phosphoribosylamino)uracil reductase
MGNNNNLKNFDKQDEQFMKLALNLAIKAKGTTFPNPSVGAVIVKNGKVIGLGATSFCGGPHAEINAINSCKENITDSTLYVTLEPCCYTGRTPPCTEAIIKSKIKRIVIATKDQNPLVNGRGIDILKKHGIFVDVGLCEKEAININEDFFFWIKNKKPWISVKLAMSLDGRITDGYGISKWITSKQARNYAHYLRKNHAGIAVGRITLEKDNPKLTSHTNNCQQPIRFVFSSKKTLAYSKTYFVSYAKKNSRSIIVINNGKECSKEKLENGVEIWHTGTKDKKKGLFNFLEMAGKEEITSILIEGGAKLVSSFLENKLVNRIYFFYGNKILGKGMTGLNFKKLLHLTSCIKISNIQIKSFSEDFMITGIPFWR